MNLNNIKHTIVYFISFVFIIGLTSSFIAKEFMDGNQSIVLNGEDIVVMQVALNDGSISSVQTASKKDKTEDYEMSSEKSIEENQDNSQEEVFKNGDIHVKIKEYQEILIELRYLRGNPDGSFGNMTEGGVLQFQKDENLEETGELDIPTQKALKSMKKINTTQDKEETKEKSSKDNKNIEHTVKPGETISHISNQYNVSSRDILKANSLSETSLIDIGDKLIIPQNN